MTWPRRAHQTPAVAGLAEQLLAGDMRFRRGGERRLCRLLGDGFLFASWAARIPQVRAELGVTPGVRGLILGPGAAGRRALIVGDRWL